jgi:hypothetical protein
VTDAEQDRIIRGFFAWIEHARDGIRSGPDSAGLDDSFDEVVLMARDEPEKLWPIIVRMVEEAPDEHHLGTVGAAPLEDLLWFHGPAFVDRIEAIAQKDPRFREALRQVLGWDSPIAPHVAERLRPFLDA